MSQKTVLRMGDPRLLQKAEPVILPLGQEVSELIVDMRDTMKAYNGAGLAAPQIGVNLQVVIFGIEHNPRYPDAEPVPQTVLINPQIEVIGEETDVAWEGCLSVPGMRGKVRRPTNIIYAGYDENGDFFERHARGFHARVVQHEVDHLLGILYPMRIDDLVDWGFVQELEESGRIPKVSE